MSNNAVDALFHAGKVLLLWCRIAITASVVLAILFVCEVTVNERRTWLSVLWALTFAGMVLAFCRAITTKDNVERKVCFYLFLAQFLSFDLFAGNLQNGFVILLLASPVLAMGIWEAARSWQAWQTANPTAAPSRI